MPECGGTPHLREGNRSEYVPSLRDREIYQAVVIEARPLEEVAEAQGLHRRTVRDIAMRVEQALAREFHELLQLNRRQELLQHIDRLEAQWREAMQAWYDSRKELKTLRVHESGDKVTRSVTSRKQSGQPRLLAEARRLLRELKEARAALAYRIEEEEREERMRAHPERDPFAGLPDFMRPIGYLRRGAT